MPSIIDINFLENLQDDYKNYPCFIETTYTGESILEKESLFEKLYTIETDESRYNNIKNTYTGSKTHFLLGDSTDILRELLPSITDKCIFFIDGHFNAGKTEPDNVDFALIEEILHIFNLFNNEAIIIIDNYKMFVTNFSEKWETIKKPIILNILTERIKKVYHLNGELQDLDMMIIHINSK